ncbi:MAG TPA: cobyric acid synthase [bacterium]|nr:cobyric acid synthase [bacterium]HPN29344.1 cobyric acid synthase [bacterium]
MKKKSKAIMFVGTGSDTGKSIITAAFCRILKRRGLKVAPFKAQNMALNSYVCDGGYEIGRAQAYQAFAAGIKPDSRMNPVLLKPSSDSMSQVIINGKPLDNFTASNYYKRRKIFRNASRAAFDSLSDEYDFIVIEGAGSPAEINLMKYDIVNMSMAEYAQADTYLIGDIDKGGVFASLKGTIDLLPEKHKKLLKGIIINKFRGDMNLLIPAFKMFRKYSKIPITGVLPYIHNLTVDEEDSLMRANISVNSEINSENKICVGILALPHTSNFTDFDPFIYESDVLLKYIYNPEHIQDFDCVIIPGSKSVAADYLFLKERNSIKTLRKFAENKKKFLFGVCGGLQMLGSNITDSDNIEGSIKKTRLLNFFNFNTELKKNKILRQVDDAINFCNRKFKITGYEIHNGVSDITQADKNFMMRDNIAASYIHGLFDNDSFRRAFLNHLRSIKGLKPVCKITNITKIKEKNIDCLAHIVETNLSSLSRKL